MELSLSNDDEESDTRARTDALGDASGQVTLRMGSDEDDYDNEQWTVTSVSAIPTLPEEAQIETSSEVAVFRATAMVDASATLVGTRVNITGKVSDVVFERFETAPPSELWDVDPRGAGRPDAAVQVKVVQSTPVRRLTGTRYDFITKQVEPVYDYTSREEVVSRQTVRTGADGAFRLAVTVKGGDRSYEVQATYTDEGQRRVTGSAWAGGLQESDNRSAWLEAADPEHELGEYSVGEEVRVKFVGGLEKAPVSRYFYAVAHRGLTYATVGTSPTFRTTFTAASVPSVRITAVRFNGYGYDLAVSSFRAQLRLADRTLTVQVTPDKARYRPGRDGERDDPDPRSGQEAGGGQRLRPGRGREAVRDGRRVPGRPARGRCTTDVNEGIIAWAASHRTPGDDYGDGKDTTGGGGDGDGRSDFRDWLVARMITTGIDGTARVTVPLSDDLTSWHVSAAAVDAALEAGSGTGIPVGLPFFVEATMAPEYLVTDRPIIRVRGFGCALDSGSAVTFTVSSDTLLMSGVTVTAEAFKAAEVPLPPLKQGTHRVRITATAGSGSTLRSDTLTRTFDVVTTRTTRLETTWTALDRPVDVKAGSELTRGHAGRCRAWARGPDPAGARLDRRRPFGPRSRGRAREPGAGRAVRPRGPGRDRGVGP